MAPGLRVSVLSCLKRRSCGSEGVFTIICVGPGVACSMVIQKRLRRDFFVLFIVVN